VWCSRATRAETRPRGPRTSCWTTNRQPQRHLASRTDTNRAHNTSLRHSLHLQPIDTPALCRYLRQMLTVICPSVSRITKQVSKVMWQKAASPYCPRSRRPSRGVSGSLFNGSLNPHESALEAGSWSVQPFLHSSTHRQTDTQTTLRATAVAVARILGTACWRCGLKS